MTKRKVVCTFVGTSVALLVALGLRTESIPYWWARHVMRTPLLSAPRVLDLGARDRGTIAEARLTLGNRGGRKLLVEEFTSSCGCQVLGRFEGDKFVAADHLDIDPDETAELTLRLAVQGRIGSAVAQRISFRTNDPRHAEVTIPVLVAKVTGGVYTVPKFADLGDLVVGRQGRQLLEVRDDAPVARQVTRVVVTDPKHVKARFIPAKQARVLEGADYVNFLGHLEITAAKEVPGRIASNVEIFLNEAERKPDTIPILARVVPLVQAAPDFLLLPRMSQGGPIYGGQCLCRSTDGSALTLAVKEKTAGLLVKITPMAQNPDKVTVQIDCAQSFSAAGHDGHVRFWARAGESRSELILKVRLQAPASGGVHATAQGS